MGTTTGPTVCSSAWSMVSNGIGKHPVRGIMAIGEGLDVDKDLFAHIDPAFDGCRTHVRQQDHIGQIAKPWVDGRFIFENIETGAGDFTRLKSTGKGGFVNDPPRECSRCNSAAATSLVGGQWQTKVAGVGQLMEIISIRDRRSGFPNGWHPNRSRRFREHAAVVIMDGKTKPWRDAPRRPMRPMPIMREPKIRRPIIDVGDQPLNRRI